MNEKGANIDLLFRNGLKDYEVLPPTSVWEGVHSAVKSKSRPKIILRVAASVAILMTISFFTYRWSRDVLRTPVNSAIAYSVPVNTPEILKSVNNERPLISIKKHQVKNSSEVLPEVNNQVVIIQDAETPASTGESLYIQETKGLSLINSEAVRLTPMKKVQKNPIPLNYPELQIFPEVSTPKLQNRWSIAAMASPTYYSRFNSGNDELSKQLMDAEEPLVSYSGGLAFSYKISKRFSIQSGLYYSSLGQKLDGINSFDGFKPFDNSKGDHNFEVLTTTGTIFTNNPDVFLSAEGSGRLLTAYTVDVFDPKKASLQYLNNSLSQNFSYLELPVILRYKVIDKTIGINVIGGLSYNLLVNNSVYTTIDGNKYSVGKTQGLNPLMLSSSLGMGMEYNVSKKLSLNLEPTLRYYLNPFSVSTGTYFHPYSFGIFSGVSYKF
jgi:hypothetical protein